MLSEAEQIILKDQLQSTNASFYVKYIGFIEVETAFHDLKELPEKRIAICNGCASLIAQAANLISKNSIDPETKKLIGNGEPECINNEIELIITNKIIRLSNFSNKKFSKKIEIPNASFAMSVGNTLENGFVFIGKEKTKKTMKRFCFLLQSQESPDNILRALNVAISMCDSPETNIICFYASGSDISQKLNEYVFEEENAKLEAKFLLPSSSKHDHLSFLNVENEEESITTNLSIKKQDVKPDFNFDNESCQKSFSAEIQKTEKNFKNSDDIIIFQEFEEQNLYSSNNTIGNHCQKDSSNRNSFGDNLFLPLQINNNFKTPCTKKRFELICENIEQLPNYVKKKITRFEAENLLKNDGSYLIRKSVTRPLTVVLSVCQENKIHHICLNDENGIVLSGSRGFVSIYELVEFHTRKNIPFIIDSSNSE